MSATVDDFAAGHYNPAGLAFGSGKRFSFGLLGAAANLKINDPFRGNYDGVTGNELGFNKVFPYEPTPQNGRNIVR